MSNKLTRIIKSGIHLVILIVACLLLEGCDNSETFSVPSQDRPFFEDGDTLLFKDVSGNTDSLIVILLQGFEQHDKGDSYERIVLRYQEIPRKVSDYLDILHVTQYIDGASASSDGVPFIKKQFIDQIQLGDGTVVNRVSEFGRSPNMITDADVELIYFAPHYGVIKYKYHSGAVFELVLP